MLTPEEKAKISAEDRSGRHILSAYMAVYDPAYAPVALHSLLKFCYDRGIAAQFNDAAATRPEEYELYHLDSADPATRKLIEDHVPEEAGGIIYTQLLTGMAIRNRALADHAVAHMDRTDADFYVLPSGRDHLFGVKGEELCADSLSARFAGRAAVVPVFIARPGSGIETIPPEARDMLANAVIVTGLDPRGFKGYTPDEAGFLREIARQSGMSFPVFDAQDPESGREKLQQDVLKAIPRWLADAGIELK
ncbi:MAG TPA: hypothetical protein VIF12_05290 [Micavibrio sp.]|jgi:hypothetical protein